MELKNNYLNIHNVSTIIKITNKNIKNNEKANILTLWPLFYGWSSTASRLEPLREEAVSFLPLVPRNSWYSDMSENM